MLLDLARRKTCWRHDTYLSRDCPTRTSIHGRPSSGKSSALVPGPRMLRIRRGTRLGALARLRDPTTCTARSMPEADGTPGIVTTAICANDNGERRGKRSGSPQLNAQSSPDYVRCLPDRNTQSCMVDTDRRASFSANRAYRALVKKNTPTSYSAPIRLARGPTQSVSKPLLAA